MHIIKNLYDGQLACVHTEKGNSEWFSLGQGVRQGCILSPTLFNMYAEYIMRNALNDWNGGLSIGGWQLSNLRYADDTTLLTTTLEDLQCVLEKVKLESEAMGLRLNVAKTKIMIIGGVQPTDPLMVDGKEVEQITQFNFLGALITTDGSCKQEIRRRLTMARSAMANLSTIWADRGVTKATKVRLVRALVFPIATYSCETWSLTKADRDRINAFELWCWRKMLKIPWVAKRTNISVLHDIGVKNRLLDSVNRQTLSYFGHIARRQDNCLEKVLMQGKIEGSRRRGRPRARWMDRIKNLTGQPLTGVYKLAADRQQWRAILKVTNCQT